MPWETLILCHRHIMTYKSLLTNKVGRIGGIWGQTLNQAKHWVKPVVSGAKLLLCNQIGRWRSSLPLRIHRERNDEAHHSLCTQYFKRIENWRVLAG